MVKSTVYFEFYYACLCSCQDLVNLQASHPLIGQGEFSDQKYRFRKVRRIIDATDLVVALAENEIHG